jgi:hypothetical protein
VKVVALPSANNKHAGGTGWVFRSQQSPPARNQHTNPKGSTAAIGVAPTLNNLKANRRVDSPFHQLQSIGPKRLACYILLARTRDDFSDRPIRNLIQLIPDLD